jgi:hypothetical protein
MRSSEFFESADVRLLNEPLQRVTHAAVDLYAVADEAAAHLGPAAHATSPQAPGASITNTNDMPHENAAVVSALLRAADRRAVARARMRLRSWGRLRRKDERGRSEPRWLPLVGPDGGSSGWNSRCACRRDYDGLLVRNGLAERSYCGRRRRHCVHPARLDGAAGEDHFGSCANHSCRGRPSVRHSVLPSALCFGLRLNGSGTRASAAGMWLHHCTTRHRPARSLVRGVLRGRLAHR